MTPAESLEVFGTTINAKYYNGSDYTDCSFSYVGTVGINSVFPYASGGDYVKGGVGRTLLKYAVDSTFSPVLNPSYITFDIAPLYSIFDTTQIHSCIALSSQGAVSGSYLSPTWEWIIGGQYTNFENSALDDNGYKAYFWSSENLRYTFVPMDFVGQSTTSGYSQRATFAGNISASGTPRYTLLIGCPYIDSSASGSEGTFTTGGGGSGGSDINVAVTVNINMDDTNNLLTGIAGQVGSIESALYGGTNVSELTLGTVQSMPVSFDETAISEALAVLNDVPEELAGGGFIWYLAYKVLHVSSPLFALFPLLLMLSLAAWCLWRG